MRYLGIVAVGCVLALMGRPSLAVAAAEAPPTKILLRIKFEPGIAWKTTYSRSTAQESRTSDGTTERVTEQMKATYSSRVARVDREQATLESEITEATVTTQADDDPAETEPLPKFKGTHVITTRAEVVSSRYEDEDGEATEAKAPPGGSLGPESGYGALILPEAEVGVGDTWDYRTRSADSEDNYTVIKCRVARFVTYAGRPCVEIEGEYTVHFPKPRPEDQMPEMMMEADASITATFTMYFDYERGRTVAGKVQSSTKMQMAFIYTTDEGQQRDEVTVAARTNEQFSHQYPD